MSTEPVQVYWQVNSQVPAQLRLQLPRQLTLQLRQVMLHDWIFDGGVVIAAP